MRFYLRKAFKINQGKSRHIKPNKAKSGVKLVGFLSERAAMAGKSQHRESDSGIRANP
jgi:hypothetical protein